MVDECRLPWLLGVDLDMFARDWPTPSATPSLLPRSCRSIFISLYVPLPDTDSGPQIRWGLASSSVLPQPAF